MESIRELATRYPNLLTCKNKETEEALQVLETALEVRLPADARWLASQFDHRRVLKSGRTVVMS